MSDPVKLRHKLCVTNAPDAYDYGYVIPVPAIPTPEGWRTIAIPTEAFTYQTDRYRSGMYGVAEA